MKEYINVETYIDATKIDSLNITNNSEIDDSTKYIDGNDKYPTIPNDANYAYYKKTELNAISGGYSYYGRSASARIAAQITKRSNYVFFIDENGYRRARRDIASYKKLKEAIEQKVIEADDIEWRPFIIGNSENAVITEGEYAGNYVPSKYNVPIQDTDDLIRVISDLHQRVLSEDPQFGVTATTEVKHLRDLMARGELIEGKVYQITNYTPTVDTLKYTVADGQQFDICVLAITKNKISELAWAVHHDNDEYYKNSDLSKWQIWYDINGTKIEFNWVGNDSVADTDFGVIYRLIDEYGNDLPYDFKNIKLGGTNNAVYTFSYNENGDDSMRGTSHGNKIQQHMNNGTSYIPNITFGENCTNNIFNDCENIRLGNNSNNNIFENGCCHIQLINTANNTIFETGCSYIELGASYYGGMNNCRFESGVTYVNSVDNFYANNMIIEAGVKYINIDWLCTTNHTHPSNNIKICSGIHGASNAYKTIEIYDCGNACPVIYEAGNNKTYVID